MQIQLTRVGANGSQFIRFSETKFNEDGIGTDTRTGFLPVDPAKAEQAHKAFLDGKYKARFGTFNRQNSLYNITVIDKDGVELTNSASSGAVTEVDQTTAVEQEA